MQMILLHVPGATSYENWRMMDGNILESFRAAAIHPIAPSII